MELEGIRLKERTAVERPGESAPRLPRHASGERFLKGPIPWSWISAASVAAGRGSGLKVAIALWHMAGIRNQPTIVLHRRLLDELGVDRHAAYRGLRALERAGLVAVERHAGRLPRVTILAVDTSP